MVRNHQQHNLVEAPQGRVHGIVIVMVMMHMCHLMMMMMMTTMSDLMLTKLYPYFFGFIDNVRKQ